MEGQLTAVEARCAFTESEVAAHIDSIYSGATEFTVNVPEQKFYLKLTEDDYINLFTNENVEGVIYIENKSQNSQYQTQFTQAEIDSNPELKKFDSFKIPVPVDELAE